MPEKMSF